VWHHTDENVYLLPQPISFQIPPQHQPNHQSKAPLWRSGASALLGGIFWAMLSDSFNFTAVRLVYPAYPTFLKTNKKISSDR